MSDLIELIDDSPFLTGEHLARLTSRYVSVPSVNGQHHERDLALVIAADLDDAGWTTHVVGDERRPSIAATFGSADPAVVLNGHLDTVPVDDAERWEHDPFAGVIAGGRVHGRGACDMKAGLAIKVAVGQWLAHLGRHGGVVLQFAMGEERGEPGTEDLIEAGFVAPYGIVLEPTDEKIGVAQRGLLTIRVTVEGRAGHASRPDLTNNPIDRLPKLLEAIGRLAASTTTTHPLLGRGAWTTTGISAGTIPSMVPAEAVVLVDRRMVPGETATGALDEVREAATAAIPDALVTASVVEEEGIYEPAEVPAGGVSATALIAARDALGYPAEIFGTPYSSDVRHLVNTAGVDAITFGPGRFEHMHARDEHIDIHDVQRAARAVAIYCARLTQG